MLPARSVRRRRCPPALSAAVLPGPSPGSQLLVTNTLDANATWDEAVAECDALNNSDEGGVTAGRDWRLPTLKELFQFRVNGIFDLHLTTMGDLSVTGRYWTATTDSIGNQAWGAYLYAYSENLTKDSIRQVLCVR